MKTDTEIRQHLVWAEAERERHSAAAWDKIENIDDSLLEQGDPDEEQALEEANANHTAVLAYWHRYIKALKWVLGED